MVMELAIKALAGAAIVVVIQLFSRTENYFIAGVVPLFPTFSLISHFIVGTERTTSELKETIGSGLLALIPYLVYLASLYFLVDRLRLGQALLVAAGLWLITAVVVLGIWRGV
jgi:membrane protein GlpM